MTTILISVQFQMKLTDWSQAQSDERAAQKPAAGTVRAYTQHYVRRGIRMITFHSEILYHTGV